MSFYDILRKQILPLEEIDKYLPNKGQIVDLGCGQGVISKFVAKKKSRKVTGVDLNASRLSATNLKNLNFNHQNILNYNFSNVSGVILSDVLHHLNLNNQKKILKKTSKGLKKEGILIIKEIDTREFIRSRFSRLWDFVLYPNEKIFFRNLGLLQGDLVNIGFKVKLLRVTRLFPGSTNLLICKKSD